MTGSPESEGTPQPAIESEHSGPLLRLQKLLSGRQSFTLVILAYSDSAYRNRLVDYLQDATSREPAAEPWNDGQPSSPNPQVVDAQRADGNFGVLLDRLAEASEVQDIVHLVGVELWPEGLTSLWHALNYQREQIAERCPKSLLLWILRDNVASLALEAPDLWAWRSGVFDFGNHPVIAFPTILKGRLNRSQADATTRRRRIEEIDAYLREKGDLNRFVDLQLNLERGHLQKDLGDWDGALESFRIAAKGFAQREDWHSEAKAKQAIASVLVDCGELAHALDLLQREVLPTFEKLGDLSSRAMAMGTLAGIAQKRGDLDEALHIRQYEQLPIFERIGNIQAWATTQSKIADIRFDRGDLDGALSIQKELLPVFEQLDDLHSRAITFGKIADIREALGDLDEALSIRRQEELPTYDRLGDEYALAITKAKTGHLLFKRGEREEAKHLLSEAIRDADRLKIPEVELFRSTLHELEAEDPAGTSPVFTQTA